MIRLLSRCLSTNLLNKPLLYLPPHFSTIAKKNDNVKCLDTMDESYQEKINSILPHLQHIEDEQDGLIVDIGVCTGKMASFYANTFKNCNVIGTDIIEKNVMCANSNETNRNNIVFVNSPANKQIVTDCSTSAFIFCSVMHEIYSYGNHINKMDNVKEVLGVTRKSLKDDGVIIIRDFVKPKDNNVVIMSHQNDDIQHNISFDRYCLDFLRAKFNKVDGVNEVYGVNEVDRMINGFSPQLFEMQTNKKMDCIDYITNAESAYEFIFRKDYWQNYKAELEEIYGFWSKNHAEKLLTENGFKVIFSEYVNNDWINKNRIDGKIQLFDPSTGKNLKIPNYQLVIVGKKVSD
jgi:precorrin-6B methylase 2